MAKVVLILRSISYTDNKPLRTMAGGAFSIPLATYIELDWPYEASRTQKAVNKQENQRHERGS